MSDLMLDTSGDLSIVGGDLVLVDGIDAIKQLLTQRLKFFLGEWFLALDKGIPYFEKVLIKNPNQIVLDTIFKKQILSTPGVQALEQFDLQLNTVTRSLAVTLRARTTQGIVDFNSGVINA
jgi:hypothetical protein